MLNILFLMNIPKETIYQIFLIFFIIIIFYIFSIRPQRKKIANQKNFLNKLKPGLDIITIGGLHGKIVSIDKNSVVIGLNNRGTQVTIEKTAISIEASNMINAK